MKKNKVKRIRSRFYMVMQYEKNPVTGEDLGFDEMAIKLGIKSKADSLVAWAYIRHDKDVYNQDDDIPDNKSIGDVRPPHWHVMLQFKNAIDITSLANAFNVKENYIESWRGNGAFLDGIQYLTHEHPIQQDYGKHLYSRDEVVFASEQIADEYWEALDIRTEKNLIRLPDSQRVERMIKKITTKGYTLADAYNEDSILYCKNESIFKRARQNYLKNAPLPQVRSNYYITGMGGSGKSVAAKAMARSLYPGIPDEKLWFVVGDGRVAFDGYDGQPVIIWDDWRAVDLQNKFDRGTIWKIFAVNPEKISMDIKYGDINLINTVNIITCVQPFIDFMKDLAGEYVDKHKILHKAEDIGQGYRRFPVFIEVTRQSLEIFVSQWLTGGEFAEYQRVCRVNASIIDYAKNEKLEENSQEIMKPAMKIHKKVREKHGNELEGYVPKKIDVKVEYDSWGQTILNDD